MDRLQQMTVFVAVAEEQSFAGGARRLGMSPPAVTRAVAALENRLGVKLLNRSTRHVRATDAGRRYLHDARRVIAGADEADEAAAGVDAAPRGHLSVTAPVLFGRMFVTPGIVAYLRRHAAVDISTLFVDRVVNMLEEGLDVAVRIGELPDSSLRAVPVGRVRQVVCASPEYLAGAGRPRAPAAVADHLIVSASAVTPGVEWRFWNGRKPVPVRVKPRLLVNGNDAAIEAVTLGFGLSRLLSYQVARHLESGRLEAVLTDFEPPPLPIHVVHGEGRRASAKVRSFVAFMAERLRADPALR